MTTMFLRCTYFEKKVRVWEQLWYFTIFSCNFLNLRVKLYTSLSDWNCEWNISGKLCWLKQVGQKTTGLIIRSRLKISISWVSNVSKTFHHLSITTWRWLRKIFTCRLTFWALAHLRFFQAAVNWCSNRFCLELNNWFVYVLLFRSSWSFMFSHFPKDLR